MHSGDIKAEICVDSIGSAIAAAEGGASRIELCSALTEGGLTPTVGTLQALKQLPLNIPIYCMLRPRRGNDFVYTDLEFQSMATDMRMLIKSGADGFVFGALTSDRKIDVEKCDIIIQTAAGLPVTFHRAFDITNPNEMHDTVDQIKRIGFQRILTSGFSHSALEGSERLANLIAKHHNSIVIMPGAGITACNLDDLLTVTKCKEFHSSAKSSANFRTNNDASSHTVTMGKSDMGGYEMVEVNVVREMVAIAKGALK